MKNRIALKNLDKKLVDSNRKVLTQDDLRLVGGGLRALEACSCTRCDDVDCD